MYSILEIKYPKNQPKILYLSHKLLLFWSCPTFPDVFLNNDIINYSWSIYKSEKYFQHYQMAFWKGIRNSKIIKSRF